MGRKIAVTVKPNAKKAEVTQLANGEYRVEVREPAQDGKANQEVIELLARYFRVPKSTVRINRGLSSRHKLLELITL
jgi:uncharacterized protein (TIGR00251 family)